MRLLNIGVHVLAVLCILHVAQAQISFTPPANYPAGNQPFWITAADVNGDGYVDLITGNNGDSTLSVLTNGGANVFGSNATYQGFANTEQIVAADVNGDGFPDLVCASTTALTVLTNDGTGHFAVSATFNFGDAGWVIAADVNGDGFPDLITDDALSSSLVVLTNDGTGAFVAAATPGVLARTATTTDVNGDGQLDIIEVDALHNSLVVLTNAGGGNLTFCSSNGLSTQGAGLVTAVDANGDGKMDVIVPDYSSGNGNTLTVYTNDGSGHFGTNGICPAGPSPFCVVAADLNGDGRKELICASEFAGLLTILTNDGAGNFGSNMTLNVPYGTSSVVAADLNGDGKLDLATVGQSVSVMDNTSMFPPATSSPRLSLSGTGGSLNVSWPSSAAGWSLQQRSNLSPGAWVPGGYDGYPILDGGTNQVLALPAKVSQLYFRLFHP